MATAHAKNYPPSAAKRWLPCPFSATLPYENRETDASKKGDLWHDHMETRIVFGTLPVECDPDAAEAMDKLAEYVDKRFKEAGPDARIYVEVQLDVTETEEFGTADIVIVSPTIMIVGDEKSGYVPVEADHNEQMLTYLCGAIDLYGPRPKYELFIHQPNFDHIDGSIRTWEPTEDDIRNHRARLLDSVANPERVLAGPHCKATYCEHRGACDAFRIYCFNDLSLGWHTSELKGMSDTDLSKALDASDELAGWRTELRAEAMRRIMNMDRKIDGYKVVKGRRNRAVRDARGLVNSVTAALGADWAVRLFPDLSWIADLAGALLAEEALKHLGSPKHIEDVLKQYARVHKLPRGGWQQLYDNVVGAYIAEQSNGLTLERAIDGRPAHARGSEFGSLVPAASTSMTTIL